MSAAVMMIQNLLQICGIVCTKTCVETGSVHLKLGFLSAMGGYKDLCQPNCLSVRVLQTTNLKITSSKCKIASRHNLSLLYISMYIDVKIEEL